MKPSLIQKQNKGIQWNTITSVLVFLIQFSVSYFLNKLVSDDEFGKALWAWAIIGFSLFFSHFSWFDILIRTKQPSEKTYSTAFFVSLASNLILFTTFFFFNNKIANFSKEFDASTHLKLYSCLFLVNAFAMVPTAKLTKNIEFKKLSQFSIVGKLSSSILAIVLAIQNKPFLSLFFLYLGSELTTNLLIIVTTRWLPKFKFDKQLFTKNLGLSASLTFQKFASNISNSLDSILIGRNYLDSEVGSYLKSYGVRSMPISFLARSITKVSYPILSEVQDNPKEFDQIYFANQHLLGFLLFPIFALLFSLAKPFAIAYFSTDWDIKLIATLLQIFAISGVFATFQSHFESLLNIKANALKLNKITFLQRGTFVLLIVCSLPFGLIYIAVAKLISSIIDFIIFGHYSNQYIKTNYWSSLKQLAMPLINSITSGCVAFLFSTWVNQHVNALIVFLLSSLLFGLTYLVLAIFIDKSGIKQVQLTFLNKQ